MPFVSLKNNIMFKKSFLFVISNLLVVFAYGQLQIIPQPQSVTSSKGEFVIDNKSVIACTSPQFQKQAELLADYLKNSMHVLIQSDLNYTGKNRIELKENSKLEEEAYQITVNKERILCEAATPAGMFYAMQTLIQSINVSDNKVTLPVLSIKDAPRYAWRGLLLDEARHFFGKEVVKQILDVMAYLKMNRFHWHLTDEPAWRIEIKKYPNLTEIGGVGNWHDQNAPRAFYTQEDIREIVAYASERHIMVIPEIEMPGHAIAANRSYPEFSAGGIGRWNGFTFHPAREATYDFISDIFAEIVQLFPSPYIHIGGDEVHYGNQTWFTDPEIQQFIKDNNLKDEKELEHYFVRRVCDIVNSKGRIMIGWDEIVDAGISPDKAIAMWWRPDLTNRLPNDLEKGFRVIMAPCIPFYLDYLQDAAHVFGMRQLSLLQNIYSAPDDLSPLIIHHPEQMMGIQTSLWTEFIADEKRLYFQLFPRLAGIAEIAWTNPKSKDYARFEMKLKSFLQYLDRKGINYFNPFDPASTPEPWGPNKGGGQLSLPF